MRDVSDILYEYVDQAGIVVKFPHSTEDYANAIIEYAGQLESELIKQEKENERLKTKIDMYVGDMANARTLMVEARAEIARLQDMVVTIDEENFRLRAKFISEDLCPECYGLLSTRQKLNNERRIQFYYECCECGTQWQYFGKKIEGAE